MKTVEQEIRELRAQLADLRSAGRPFGFVGARYSTNAGQSVPTSTYTVVDYEDQDYDPDGLVTTGASWAFTCPVGGYYLVSAGVRYNGTASWDLGEQALLVVRRSTVDVAILDYLEFMPGGTSIAVSLFGSEVLSCAAGDTIDVRTYQATGSSLALNSSAAAAQYNRISVTLVR